MRYTGLVLLMSAVVLNACAGGDKPKPADSPAAAVPSGPATAMPITGDTVTVRMTGAGTAFSFEPADITVKAGGGIKFISVAGFPHNVRFPETGLPADVKAQLLANMPNQFLPLQSGALMQNESYVVSFAGVKPGKYVVDCPLHLAFNMKGTVTVQ